MSDKPVKQWCQDHWSRVCAIPKASGIVASIYLMSTVMADEEFMQRAGFDKEKGTKADASPAVVNALIAEIGPICCWLGEDGFEHLMQSCRTDSPRTTCPSCGILTFDGAWDRKNKKGIMLHRGGAWDCEQAREMEKPKEAR